MNLGNKPLRDAIASHFNEPMICDLQIVRCIGYGEDSMDCYIIYKKWGGEIDRHTCVGGYTFLNRLKEQGKVISTTGEEWDDLYRLDNELTASGCSREISFMEEYHA